jgi:hypothetical protein
LALVLYFRQSIPQSSDAATYPITREKDVQRKTHENRQSNSLKVLLTPLWGYLAKWVLSPDNAFGPLVHFYAMVYWASVGMKKTPFTALWHDIADFSATCTNACANAFCYLRAFRTDRHAHAHFAGWAATWADHTTWCIVMVFCESLADPKAAFLFLFVYMGSLKAGGQPKTVPPATLTPRTREPLRPSLWTGLRRNLRRSL